MSTGLSKDEMLKLQAEVQGLSKEIPIGTEVSVEGKSGEVAGYEIQYNNVARRHLVYVVIYSRGRHVIDPGDVDVIEDEYLSGGNGIVNETYNPYTDRRL